MYDIGIKFDINIDIEIDSPISKVVPTNGYLEKYH